MASPTSLRTGCIVLILALFGASCGSDESATPGSLTALDPIDWAAEEPPTTPVGDVDPIELPDRWPEEPRAALAATFPSAAEASAAAEELDVVLKASAEERTVALEWDVVPELTPSERSWMADAGVTPAARGIGWMGPDDAMGPAVRVFGPTVFVNDLIFVSQWDDLGRDRPPNPVQAVFEHVGAEVIGEHDWIDDIGIGFDLLCTAATDERAAAIAGELADHLVLPHQAMPLPPWAGELTDEQQAIRRSYRVELSRRQATSERMTSSRAFIQAAQDLADALASGDPDDIAMRQAELAEVFDHDRPTEVSDDVHPIVASWAALDTAFGPPADEVWLSRGVALGQTDYRMVNGEHAVRSGAAAATTVYFGSAGVDGDHVQLGSFHGPAMGTLLPTISDHLESVGCTDLTYTLVDADLLWNL